MVGSKRVSTRGAHSGQSPPGRDASLRSQLLGGLGALLFVALFTLAMATVIWVRLALSSRYLGPVLALVIVADVGLLVWFADHRLRQLVLHPVARMVEGAERIAEGDQTERLYESGAAELKRLARATNEMAERLIEHQRALAANVTSLDETNRALTKARHELVHAEKLASIGRLAAGVAHEIGNPLGAIVGYVELARREGIGGDEWVSGIAYEAKRIDRIVRALLDYARPKKAGRPPLELEVGGMLRGAVELLDLQGRFSNLQVEFAIEENLPPVHADPGHLEQVFVNLLLNAADAIETTERSGVIRISARVTVIERRTRALPARRQEDLPDVDYSHLRRLDPSGAGVAAVFKVGARVLEIEFLDDGPGISAEHVTRVFDPFFTTKPPGSGTGLGLAVVAGLIEEMGGAITAAAAEGGGAVFTIVLPTVEGGQTR